ncbi:MAG: hypothetical protein H0T79_22630, partial [Deltaproteobacteria bacterium]|nr:hypothetical protein [Deltaproteobacteria bacterium]
EHRTVTASHPAPTPPARPLATCPDAVVVVEGGTERGTACESTLQASVVRHATVLDLRDAWTPKLFAPAPDGTAPDFRATYLAFAAERGVDGKALAANDALAELYGIVPSLAVVRERLGQEARYRCHAQIDSAPIAKLSRPYGQEHEGLIKHGQQTRAILGAQLERQRAKRGLPDLAALATDRELGPTYERWKAADEQHAGIVAAQRHLACEGFLSAKDLDGNLSWKTGMALELYQRRNFLIPNNRLDPETRAALATDPRELDFRFALRVLRERVVDATGLLEDGTAGDGPRPILGRMLDPEVMRAARGHEKPLPDAAQDLISAATEAAARELGWTGPAQATAFLARHPAGARVAVTLPPPPAYHGVHMELSTEIDRGDVWYDEQPIPRMVSKRPNFVLYADDHGTRRALVRWPTTIGGWSDVAVGGGVVQRWKESDVGPRVWRDLFVAPTWLPPGSTPDRDLVKWVSAGKWDLKRSIMGPGPHAAFGIVLLPHYKVVKAAKGPDQFLDNGIGTHGSAVVTSIFNGTSHGCHRLYNQLAVRLGSFLLQHRNHVVKGQKKEYYRRTVHFMGTFQARIDTRGYLYELTPPVPVEVLPGNIRSARQVPPLASAPALP